MSIRIYTTRIVNFLCSDTVEERSAVCPDSNYAIKIPYISTLAWWKIWNTVTSLLWLWTWRSWTNTPFNGQRTQCLDHPKHHHVRVASVTMLLNYVLLVLIEPRNKNIFNSAPKYGMYNGRLHTRAILRLCYKIMVYIQRWLPSEKTTHQSEQGLVCFAA